MLRNQGTESISSHVEVKMNRILNAIVITSFVLALGTVQPGLAAVESASEMIVLHVDGAPLKRGQVIDGSMPLKLESGWSVTLASSMGSFITLTGPSETIPAQSKSAVSGDSTIIETLGALLTTEKNSTAVLGVVRSATLNEDYSLPVAWAVNVEQSGTRCIQSSVALLWRKNHEQASVLLISRSKKARISRVTWPAGQQYLSVNSSSFEDGNSYVFHLDGRSVELKIQVMPSRQTSAVEQAAWMTRAGCKGQAVALIDTIR